MDSNTSFYFRFLRAFIKISLNLINSGRINQKTWVLNKQKKKNK